MKILQMFVLLFFVLLNSCSNNIDAPKMIDEIAESYVKLSLKCGSLDKDFVDAYHGPDNWKPSENYKAYPEKLIEEADALLDKLNNIDISNFDELWTLRYKYLIKQTLAIKTRIEIISGKKILFNKQAQLLFDVELSEKSKSQFENVLNELETTLPGVGNLGDRLNEFRSQFIIPSDKLMNVFNAAIDECRKRTKEYIQLPENENFSVELVSNKSWGAYNWYKGNYYSLIQVNTDSPHYIDGAIDLAAHEGYPGHHVYNIILEKKLLKELNWVEFSIYNLFSPQSLIAEGSGNYGIHVAFTKEEKIKFEKEVLFPLAGLDSSKADKFYKVMDLINELNYSRNEASQKYIDGEFTREDVIAWIMKYQMSTSSRAEQSLSFIEQYQSYVINYNVGQDIVKNYVEKKLAGSKDTAKKWKIFENLLSKPYTASELMKH